MIASKDRARANGWRPSMYRCAQRSRMLDCDNSRTINESYIGPFIFNYIANLARVQKNFKNITTVEKLERELLKGETFDGVAGILPEGLNLTFQALSFRQVGNGTYIPDIDFLGDSDGASDHNQIELLKSEIEKSKNAVTRLTDVYLFDPDSMTKEEFATKKKELAKKIEGMERKLADLLDDSGNDDLADNVIYQEGFRVPGGSKDRFKSPSSIMSAWPRN